ncbi:uncharacterized protein [Nicotiana sylvestris]|uniref:Uncharacterized protein LOC104229923 isoform X1 n=1 Tax=Nicotiana sylvestris TaxID=4096 RepID=A0A1U7X253_NICSY|nr:PREDICTED: uncharacterized protein LOC104229923 isoform X1 [Nicotiana sylvestris]
MRQRKKVKDKMVTSIEQVTIPDHLPEFFKIYHPQICNFQLRIPPVFLKFFNGDIPANYKLEDLGRLLWKRMTMISWEVGQTFLKRDVIAINEPELQPLDEEIVHEIGTSARPVDQALNESGDLVFSVTSFDIVIKPSYIRKKRLNVPATFGNRYLNRGKGKTLRLLFKLIEVAGPFQSTVLIDFSCGLGSENL